DVYKRQAQACDAIMAVRVMGTPRMLREIVNFGSLIQSHALSFFYLASPDFLLGMESDPLKRNIFGLLESHPQVAKDGVRLRKFGQEVIERLAGRRLHPTWIVAGGVASPLSDVLRQQILGEIPEIKKLNRRNLDWFKRTLDDFQDEIRSFANFPSHHLALVAEDGDFELYRGVLRIVDQNGNKVQEDFRREVYRDVIGEAVEPWTYMKFPYYKPLGYPEGMYRVGSVSRLIASDRMGTKEAEQELTEFRERDLTSGFYNHYARLIECMYAVERIEELLNDPKILDKRVFARASANNEEGIGVTEAPRGTLIHHYKIDEQGRIAWANLVVATTHNNLAMNRGVLQVARRYVDSANLTEGMLNRVEAVIRTFDPCLSCSTHNQGSLALHVELVDADGKILDEARR
ncbi:MAG: Ni/Fe hydrogenase subunit alpha, partial [Chloroflexi bacterium]|nr:Ni/Fe hydrogenase subunit alpha [Chloroflexota bacterium]